MQGFGQRTLNLNILKIVLILKQCKNIILLLSYSTLTTTHYDVQYTKNGIFHSEHTDLDFFLPASGDSVNGPNFGEHRSVSQSETKTQCPCP